MESNETKVISPNIQVDKGYSYNFAIFTAGRLISELGTSIFRFALSLYILDITGSAAAFSLVLGFTILPGVLINIFAGVFVDRCNKKKVIVFCDILSGLSMFVFTIIFKFNPANIAVFIGYAIVTSIIQSFFSLALNASIPCLVEKDKVVAMNSGYQAVGAIINVLGPVMGALAYKFFGLYYVLLIEGASFIFAGIIEIFLRYKSDVDNEQPKSYFESLKDVFRYLKEQNAIKMLLGVIVIINFLFTPLMAVALPFLAYKVLAVSANQLSAIQALWFIGVILGAIVVSAKMVSEKVRNKLFILLQLQALVVILWLFSKIGFIDFKAKVLITVGYCIIMFIGGILNAMTNIPMLSYVQVCIPEKIRASIFGVINTACQIAVPLGMWVYGLALEHVDWGIIVGVSGVFLLVIGMISHMSEPLREFFNNTHSPQ